MTLNIRAGARTDVGRRRSGNEDAYLADETQHLYAVADGMGGHQGGEVASSMALQTVQSKVTDGTSLDSAVVQANEAVLIEANDNPELVGMGCTLTAVTFPDQRTARFAHVGDSRAYLLRDGELTQITEDHSVVGELVRGGRLTPEQAEIHPHRSMLTRAVGIEEPLHVDSYDVDMLDGDRIMLCSDGLTTMVPNDAIKRTLRKQHDPERAAVALVDMANKAGGIDNITVIVLDVGNPGDRSVNLAASAAEPGDGEPTGHWEPGDGPAAQTETGETSETDKQGEQVPARDDHIPSPLKEARQRSGRRRVTRIAMYAIPAFAVIGLGFAALGWYARSTYFVGIENGQVVLSQGVPDGFLGWDPTVELRSDLNASELTQAQRSDLRDGHRFGDRASAAQFLKRLERSATERAAAELATTTTTTTTLPVAPPPAALPPVPAPQPA